MFGVIEPIVIAITFGFFISLDRVNREQVSVLRELKTHNIEHIAKLIELYESKKFKIIEICNNPEKHF